MSFPLSDLKKSVRKTKEGYQVRPALLELQQARRPDGKTTAALADEG